MNHSQLRFTLLGAEKVGLSRDGVSRTQQYNHQQVAVMSIWFDHVLIINYNYPRIDSLERLHRFTKSG
jgi:hypothetical protein